MKNMVLILFAVIICSCGKPIVTKELDGRQFNNPPSNYRVHVWWHWNGGIITREGITRDLESMKKQGVSEATILNIGASYHDDMGVDRVVFNSEEWHEMFRWSLEEANRLGITIGVHNCDGWSTSGGPWITPEKAMKKYVFTKTQISGNQEIVKLPKPICESDFYRDVAVVAVRKARAPNRNEHSVMPRKVSVNDSIDGRVLFDGDPQTKIETKVGYVIDIENPTKALKTKIDLFQNYVGVFYFMRPPSVEYIIKVSDDGVYFRKIAELKTKKFFTPEIFEIPATHAPFFRIEVAKIHHLRPWHHMGLSEVQLLNGNEQPLYFPTIQDPLEKTSSVRVFEADVLMSKKDVSEDESVISGDEVLDVTDRMQADGTIKWSKPEGDWELIRFGYTSAKAYNMSASKEGHGLEVDKMDTASLNFHFSKFPQKLIDEAGAFTGNTFKFFLIDSWESGYQTWTHAMQHKFEKLRGYEMIKWIPVLCGETIGSQEQSNAFLYDFRRTIADLLEQNFYEHYRQLCHRNNMKLHAEAIYGNNYPAPPIDVINVNGLLDMPMVEFWAPMNDQSLVEYQPREKGQPQFAVYAPNFYNIKSVGAEAYTGFAHYSESLYDLKLIGDCEYTMGVSQMVLHSYAHQPIERKPGFTLGRHGSHFNRHNPVWQYARGWIDYQSRIQYVLQDTKIPAKVLYYLGDQFPQFIENDVISSLPLGYQSVPCNLDVLSQLNVVDGEIRFSGDQKYSLLVLPDSRYLSFEALKQIERLANKGAVIYGRRPEGMLSLFDQNNFKQEFLRLVQKMWLGFEPDSTGRNNYGKGTIIWGEPIADLLMEFKIKPDFSTQMEDSKNILFIHKNTENADVFFVVNQLDSVLNRECYFNTTYNTPEIWDPINGEIKKVAIYTSEDGGIRIPVTLTPEQSLLFVFRDRKQKEHINSVQQGTSQLFPSPDSTFDAYVPKAFFNEKQEINFVSDQAGKYTFTTNNGKEYTKELRSPDRYYINNFEGQVKLQSVNTGRIDTLQIKELRSFTEYREPDVKYFSGVATYQIDFQIPLTFLGSDNPVYLKVGKLDATAKVSLNGESLGYVWTPNRSISVEGRLKENNRLTIELGTTCRNRFIGDFREYGEMRNVWSTADVGAYLNKKSIQLKPTGVMGPLMLIKYVSDDE